MFIFQRRGEIEVVVVFSVFKIFSTEPFLHVKRPVVLGWVLVMNGN